MNVVSCPYLSLCQASDLYNIFRGNDTRKYGKQVEIIAAEVFKEIFRGTLMITKSVYVPLKGSSTYNYVDIPSDCMKFLSASVEDRCHNMKPLYYNDALSVIVKPKIKTCSCTVCDCGGLCEAIGGLSATFKTVNINGTDYTETTWIKFCDNGDVMEYRTIPTISYTFDRGAYDSSYDISYDIGDEGSSEVVYYNLSRKLCYLEMESCGCPKQTPENESVFFANCGCYCNPLTTLRHCKKYWGECNYYAGEVSASECGTKLFVKHVQDFDVNKQILINYQTNGINPDAETVIPDYAKMALFTGIDYYKNLFNDRINPRIKQEQYYKYIDEQNKIIVYINKIAIENLESLPEMATF